MRSFRPLNTCFIGYTPFDRDTQKQEMEAIIAGDYRFEPGMWSTCLDRPI